ncbi:MAG: DUF190 domain-containing protein [Bacteroidales bacterium]
MIKSNDVSVLRIYASSTDKFEGKPLYEIIVYRAKEAGLSGTTVLRGVMGYGASSVVHSSKLWELTEKLPVIVEIVDDTEQVNLFFESVKPLLEKSSKGFLVTRDKTDVLYQKSGLITGK